MDAIATYRLNKEKRLRARLKSTTDPARKYRILRAIYSRNAENYDAEWVERDHPRKENGRFAPKGKGETISEKRKQQQLELLRKTNPMRDEYHVGIRDTKDIKSAKEAFLGDDSDDERYTYPDFTEEMGKAALKKGRIKVYSSKPVKDGAFISPSKMMAQDYAGTGPIYSKLVSINDVAWLNSDEGQFAPVETKQKAAEKKRTARAKLAEAALKVEETRKFGGASYRNFARQLNETRASRPIGDRWRVDEHSIEQLEEFGAACHYTNGGSTIAVKPNGDIISVCKNPDDPIFGKDLLRIAVKNGGKKLDSFEGNHDFYTECGFEPISYCDFVDKYAPDDWLKANGINKSTLIRESDGCPLSKIGDGELNLPREQIVFYKYTGKPSKYTTLDDFKNRVKKSASYDEAQDVRDGEVD